MPFIINNFISAINTHSVNDIINLITDDHKLIDSSGVELEGKENLKNAWTEYFRMFPDYKINVFEIFLEKTTAAIIGTASGTFLREGKLKDENKWQIPAAWYAVTNKNKVKIWQVFTDVFPIIKIMEKNN